MYGLGVLNSEQHMILWGPVVSAIQQMIWQASASGMSQDLLFNILLFTEAATATIESCTRERSCAETAGKLYWTLSVDYNVISEVLSRTVSDDDTRLLHSKLEESLGVASRAVDQAGLSLPSQNEVMNGKGTYKYTK